jgi:hypothetical protein
MQLSQSIAVLWRTLLRSITDLNFYVEILNSPVRFSFKIVALFYILLSLVLTGMFSVTELPRFNATREEVIEHFPSDLVLEWQNGQLSSNAPDPIEVPFPSAAQPLEDAPKNLAIINTNVDEAPETANALLYITHSRLFVNSRQGSWTDTEIANVINSNELRIDRAQVLEWAESSKQNQQEIFTFLPILALLYYAFVLLFFRVLSMLLNALIVQLMFQLLNKPISYKKVLQICLHLLVPAEIIHQISRLTVPNLDFPMFGLAFWILVSLIIWHLRNLQVVRLVVEEDSPPKKK